MEKMNKYKLERLALEDAFARRMLLDYDIREVTTRRQALNETREFEFPVSCFSKQMIKWNGVNALPKDKLRMAVFKSGYVRKQNGAWSPYQINPVYKQNQRWMYIRDGELYTSKWVGQARELIGSQLARMNYMLNYYLKNYAK
tara:strand:- start:4274 stop:4702 length:429 start_codon:yes stop_codon:yes gene_type:complete